MKYSKLSIPDIILFEPEVFPDDRGVFFETFRDDFFKQVTGFTEPFIQENHSFSRKGVLRGMHYQLPPHAQGKLVRAVRGTVFDVAVDIRRSSPTFGKWVGEILSEENRKMLWIPPGFAHGFLALSDADFIYKVTGMYAPETAQSIAWDDPALGIGWPLTEHELSIPTLSTNDADTTFLINAKLFD